MSNERSAPLGRLWATPGDLPHQHAISREFALDSGLPDPEQYPSWPNYPDERNLPVAHEARARWKLRLAKLQKEPVTKVAQNNSHGVENNSHANNSHKCLDCGKTLAESKRGAQPKFCSGACRMKYARKQQRA